MKAILVDENKNLVWSEVDYPNMGTNNFNLNKDLMIAQLKAMEAYLSTLSIRIGLNAKFSEDSTETVENVINA